MKFRITIGVNDTPWGRQHVLFIGEGKNAIEVVREYAKDAFAVLSREDAISLVNNCWVDAGNDTIPIAVQNLKWLD